MTDNQKAYADLEREAQASAAALAAATSVREQELAIAAADLLRRQAEADSRLIKEYRDIDATLAQRGSDAGAAFQKAVDERDFNTAFAMYTTYTATREARQQVRNAVAAAEARNPTGAYPLPEMRYYEITFQDWLVDATVRAAGAEGIEISDEILAKYQVQ